MIILCKLVIYHSDYQAFIYHYPHPGIGACARIAQKPPQMDPIIRYYYLHLMEYQLFIIIYPYFCTGMFRYRVPSFYICKYHTLYICKQNNTYICIANDLQI